MNEIITRKEDIAPQLDSIWQRRLDALIRGECSEDEFMQELSNSRLTGADSAWSVVALLDQRYRRGQMPPELFRSIESKIARRELGALDYGTTIELLPAAGSPAAPPGPSPVDTVEIEIEADVGRNPADTAPPKAVAEFGRVLRDRYVLECRLGSGGMGTVFRAVDRFRSDVSPSNRVVAIKFLHDKADAHPEPLPNLRREFYCAQALSHPNIVKVYDLDRDGDVEFFTMEFLEGELLSRVIEKLDPLAMSRLRAWAIIGEVAAGLAHAHSRDVMHADLKPQNIMITQSGEMRILDFGASSASRRPPPSGETARRINLSAMTPAYASCELLEGQRADPRDDLFSLACVSYELLAGQHPFQRRRSTEARDLGLVARRPRGLTGRQWRALAQGLAWRREERSISVRDWIAELHPEQAAERRASTRNAALLAALVFGLAFSALFNRQVFERKAVTHAAASETAASAPEAAAQTQPAASEDRAETPQPQSSSLASSPAPAPSPSSSPTPSQPQALQRNARSSAPAAAKAPDMLSLAAASYRVGAHGNFAEIHVRRSNGSGGDTSFAWWTEPSSALPGSDYVPQDRTIQLLSARSQMASLFVKLVPNVARKHPAAFYVVIAEPRNGASLGRITRAAVVLPPQVNRP
jgi:serine/threonine protein kinase